MNKSELVSAIAQRTGQTATSVGEMLSALESVVCETVAGGGKIQLPGFLTIDSAQRAARTGRNPATGGEIQIPASTVPRIKAGKTFKDAVNS